MLWQNHWQMKLVIILLAMQTIVAFALTFRSISFNVWELNEGIHNREDWLSLVTGGVFLTGAGLGWYGCLQHVGWCWGFTGLRLLKLCVDAIGFVLLYFLYVHLKSTTSADSSEEQ
jgi:hypothetical protein